MLTGLSRVTIQRLNFYLFSQGKFMPMEQIFVAKDFQAGLQLLENCITKSELETISEVKGSLDLSAYKLNTDKVVTWLKTKVFSNYICNRFNQATFIF